jgi:hypothetical protein
VELLPLQPLPDAAEGEVVIDLFGGRELGAVDRFQGGQDLAGDLPAELDGLERGVGPLVGNSSNLRAYSTSTGSTAAEAAAATASSRTAKDRNVFLMGSPYGLKR